MLKTIQNAKSIINHYKATVWNKYEIIIEFSKAPRWKLQGARWRVGAQLRVWRGALLELSLPPINMIKTLSISVPKSLQNTALPWLPMSIAHGQNFCIEPKFKTKNGRQIIFSFFFQSVPMKWWETYYCASFDNGFLWKLQFFNFAYMAIWHKCLYFWGTGLVLQKSKLASEIFFKPLAIDGFSAQGCLCII